VSALSGKSGHPKTISNSITMAYSRDFVPILRYHLERLYQEASI
jgi:hypothetical protein